jgi:alpha-1,4-N-acetylglucosaminyltransferase EXTL2
VADDDMLHDAAALSFAFTTWKQQQQQYPAAGGPLIGFFPGCTTSTSPAGSGRPR